ncbi:MAG: hypothetical protein CMJ48_06785 [Planctomycetaceae bacterium]|nr:hypothetical protein [Planctomycetaceae bacterium]
MALLLKARSYSSSLDRSSWDLAVEIDRLRELGLDESDFRWLVCKGFVEHAREISFPGQERREFRVPGGLLFHESTSFVLTDAGAAAAREHHVGEGSVEGNGERVAHSASTAQPCPDADELHAPHWDDERRELSYADSLIKRFRSPSPNQETILQAFEEEHWRHRIDDPLPPVRNRDSKRRLHDTIVSLNRNQKNRLLRFMGDGTGLGINWEPISGTLQDHQ